MAIQIYCEKCYTSNSLDAKQCSNCKAPFGRNRRYRVSVSVKGRRSARIVDNLTIARELEASIKADMVREEFDITHHKVKKKQLTLGAFWETHYLPWAKQHKKSWQADSWNYHRHLEQRFSSKTLESISSLDIERMKSDLRKSNNPSGTPYAAQTIKHQIIIMRRLFNLAKKWKLYEGENPVAGVQLPHVDNQVTEFLTDEELSRLLEILDNWPFDDSAAFIKFALLTGIRKGDACKLRWEHIDFERGMLTLADPKGGKTTTIPVNKEALTVLEGLHRSSEFVFPGRGGKQRANFRGPWIRIRKAAGLSEDIRFHGLRHHFASTLVSNGVDLAVVGKLLTHKQAQTTMRYAHLMPGALQQAAAKAGELMKPKQANDSVRLVK